MLTLDDLQISPEWELISGADTGTFLSGVGAAITQDREALVLFECPNYHYVGDGEIELDGITVSEWAAEFRRLWSIISPGRRLSPWVDANTQFAEEFTLHGIKVQRNRRAPELRTEIAREYLQHNKVFLASWLEVLPQELENARWPEDTNSAGQYKRLKENDHTLDCLEHICSRRPRSKRFRAEREKTFIENVLETRVIRQPRRIDPHLGSL